MTQDSFHVIGIMSGSSLDGLDLCSCTFQFSEKKLTHWEIQETAFYRFPSIILEKLKKLTQLPILEYASFENQFTKFVAESVNSFGNRHKRFDLVACHGHTVVHIPKEKVTVQMCNGALLSSLTDTKTICDFRKRDILYGGVGTPMAPISERDLFPDADAYINLGGIANVSFKRKDDWIAYDLIPCNQVLNHFASQLGQAYDKGGELAKNGILNTRLMADCENHAFVKLDPPKSLDNTEVGKEWIDWIQSYDLGVKDILRTYTDFIANQIANIPTSIDLGTGENQNIRLLITGGGAHNTYLIETIKQIPGLELINVSDRIIDFKEAVLIAYAGVLGLLGVPNFISSVTGASEDVCGGVIYYP